MREQRIPIEIWSDIACPWCAIGERRFFRALDARPDRDNFAVVFRPFELDANAPTPGEPLRERLARRYGARAEGMMRRAGAVATAEGVAVDWERALAARTRDAHRLLGVAVRDYGESTQRGLAELLFSAQFERGADVSSTDELTRLAVAAGMDESRVRRLLASDEGEAEIQADIERAARLGIHSVPTFVFDGRFAVAGAQPSELFAELLEEVASEVDRARSAPETNEPIECVDGACLAPGSRT